MASDTNRRTFPADAPALDGDPHGVVQCARRVQQGQALGHLEADALEAADLLPEGMPLVRVTGGDLDGSPSHADRPACGGHALGDHHLVEDFRPAADARLAA